MEEQRAMLEQEKSQVEKEPHLQGFFPMEAKWEEQEGKLYWFYHFQVHHQELCGNQLIQERDHSSLA